MIYQDGVNALLAFGGAFAAGMFSWELMEIGLFGIILNIVAIPSCFIAASLDTRFGSKRMVVYCLLLLLLATIGILSTDISHTLFGLIMFDTTPSEGLFSTSAEKAYILFGLLIGIAFGPVQASSRSYLARSVRVEESGQYLGLYAFAGRATSFVAPACVGYITAVSGSARLGMSVIVVFFVVGLWLLLTTPYPVDNVNEND